MKLTKSAYEKYVNYFNDEIAYFNIKSKASFYISLLIWAISLILLYYFDAPNWSYVVTILLLLILDRLTSIDKRVKIQIALSDAFIQCIKTPDE